MFGWFAPHCPVDAAAKCWIEQKLSWLSDQFGRDVFTRRAVILPTDEYFPDPYDRTEKSVRKLLDRVCGYMDVEPRAVILKMFTGKNDPFLVNDAGNYLPTGPAGLYQETWGKTVIHIDTGQLNDTTSLVGTMAHELSHLRLMGERRVSGEEFDNELLTDLTAAFHGFEIFLGNVPRHWDSMYSKWPGTNLRRPEYMTSPMFAYVLAHCAWHRNESRPEWMKHFSFSLKASFKQGLNFLTKTRESTFQPRSIRLM